MKLRTGIVGLAVVVLAVGVLTPAQADTADDKSSVDKKVGAAKDDLAESSAAVAKAAAALDRARTEIPKAQRELASAQDALAGARAREQEIAGELKVAQEKVAREQARVDAVQGKIDLTRDVMGRIARAVYTAGPYGDVEVILESQDPSDFAERLQSVRTVVKGQSRALADLDLQRADLEATKARLQTAQESVIARRAEATKERERAAASAAKATAAKKRIDALVAARSSALASAAREKAQALAQLKKLKAEQQRLASILRGGGDGAGYPSGSLLWPAAGGITGGVGPRIHPVYGYRSCHTGIDIGAGSGSPIRAAASGTVLERTSGGPYGNRTVVNHGGGLATMYAHQSRILVSTGQSVSKGQVIGYVGSTGYSTGPHLHFEVWIGGRPYNPMGWFGGARTPVNC